jgi:SynChlorMet cassette protein ScmC
MMNISTQYDLVLNENLSWRLIATQKVAWWLDKFAAILMLKASTLPLVESMIFCSYEELSKIKNQYSETDYWSLLNDLQYMQVWENDSNITVCSLSKLMNDEAVFMSMWSFLPYFYEKSFVYGGIPQHCALLEYKRNGIIIAAVGDTGKTTCAKRVPLPWKTFCDDEALILKENNMWHAHPFPTWSDYLLNRDDKKLFDVQHNVPLSAILILQQAQSDEVNLMGKGEAALTLYRYSNHVCSKYYCHLEKKTQLSYQQQLFFNACSTSESLPIYSLKATIDGNFWKKIEDIIP